MRAILYQVGTMVDTDDIVDIEAKKVVKSVKGSAVIQFDGTAQGLGMKVGIAFSREDLQAMLEATCDA